MKKSDKKTWKRQMMGGVVYTALAAAITAVAVGSVASVGRERNTVTAPTKIVGIGGGSGKKTAEEKKTEKKSGASAFTLDTTIVVPPSKTVSDTAENVTSEVKTSSKTELPTEVPDTSAVHEVTLAEPLPDKSRPVSEEPEDEPYTGYGGCIRPCGGYVSREYAVETPIFSPTMADYRAHHGVDIACDIGTPVRAMARGEIVRIDNDALLGTTVVIAHEDGVTSVYSNLSPDLPVSTAVGKSVIAGDVIAGVGETAIMESSEVSHLHFEVRKDGKSVDPMTLIP